MKEIKIASTADIHGILDFKFPEVDILTISGDICPVHSSHHPTTQYYWIENKFIPWCYELINSKKTKHICFCGGNHDFIFEKILKFPETYHITWPDNVHYLCDSKIEIEGINIYGTPRTPIFGNWAFMSSEEVLSNYFSAIPNDLDILLSHGPAYGLNDTITQYPIGPSFGDPHIGSKSLKEHIKRVKCKWLISGHIHSANHNIEKYYYDHDNMEYINCINVSLVDEEYVPIYSPFVFSIIKED
jgi:Icc-related predicted phosphoesterase